MPPDASIPAQVLDLIRTDALAVGSHLPAQALADRLRVSRTPVNEALGVLSTKGVLRREPNRGYFLAQTVDEPAEALLARFGLAADNPAADAYFQIAEDRLQGRLPEAVTETQLRSRYGLTNAQLGAVLGRIASEGWAEKKPGYGWAFSPMLTTADSLLKSYRLRLALEPAALLEPGYRLDEKTIERCRAAEQRLLDGALATDSADALHERGVAFHEALVEASGNAFFIDTIRRVNRVRRLLSYRSMRDRTRYPEHCRQHLHLLDLLAAGRQQAAADAMRAHLSATLANHEKIRGVLE
ncbi:MAG: GntR family transcriptional regulator [Ottowia sp.]|nr:GntR family transcriptional regulator [Ottowia sp.]